MSDNSRDGRARRSKPDYGVFDPDKFWGHVLSSPRRHHRNEQLRCPRRASMAIHADDVFKPEEYAALERAAVLLLADKCKMEGDHDE